MKAGFSLFLALRYLKPKRTFFSAITLISVLGVLLGVMVLILVISVMTGFELELREKIIAFDAHLVVSNGAILEDWREVEKNVDGTPGVEAISPYVQGQVIAEFKDQRVVALVRGVDPEKERKINDVEKFIIEGHFDLSGDNAVIGSELAKALEVKVGDTITIYSPGNVGSLVDEISQVENNDEGSKKIQELKELILPTPVTITGIFESGMYQYDSEVLVVPLHIGQELYMLNDGVHGLSVRTIDPYKAEEIKDTLAPKLGPDLGVLSWIDLNRQSFEVIRMQKNMLFFLLLFIVIVAAFGVMNTLITVTVQKTREIGIMKALGADTWQIIGIFLGQGMIVGSIGTVLGLILGMTCVQYRNEFRNFLSTVMHIKIFPKEIYQFAEIPARIVPSDVAIICISGFLICSIAALIPAWFAARLEPMKALRYE